MKRIGPAELADWLEMRSPQFRERWANEIVARGLGQGTRVDGVVVRLVHQLVAFLPSMLGPHREQVEPLWVRCSELFGVIAAKRGLAAGEVIEEFQILRELVIRGLYQDPPLGGALPLALREILRLNRAIDRGVTYASVGHTDAMFFQFFEADDPSSTIPVEDLVAEAETQLAGLGEELRDILAPTGGRPLGSAS